MHRRVPHPAQTLATEEPPIDTAVILGLAGLVTTLIGSLGAPQLAAKAQRESKRMDEVRATLDAAAAQLALVEDAGRRAWRSLSKLELHSAKEFDEIVRDDPGALAFPTESDDAAMKAAVLFDSAITDLVILAVRLELSLGADHPAVEAFTAAHASFSSVETTMAFGARGTIAPGSTDAQDCMDGFHAAVREKARFINEARRIAA